MHSTEEFERLARVERVCVSQTELRSTDLEKPGGHALLTPPVTLRWPLTESSLTCWNSSQHLSHVYSPRSRQKSEELMQRESRTSGELLLPVSRRPSHWEMISQRNNGAPSRISNRISPGWFTWQTVALMLCSWTLTHTMP